ncbi:homeobox domain protein, partial [Dictyocaulus viviparus]
MLEEHARSHEEGEQCPLCSDRTLKLTEHLIQEHKIAESAVERLLAVHHPEPSSSCNFNYRCAQCTMAFRSETALRSHSILHLFAPTQRCYLCQKMCNNNDELKIHMEADHPPQQEDDESIRCELCVETFATRSALIAHINSVRHLHKAKKQLESQGSVDLSAQVLTGLQNPSSPGDKKPFRCNVCKIGYGQGATLDIHLRSVAHQSRMSKIADLVSSGDVNPSKPVLEQPGGPPQKIIRELLSRDDEPSNTQQQNVMTMFNIMNMLMTQNASVQLPFMSQPNTSSEVSTPDVEDKIMSPRNASSMMAMIKAFGEKKLSALSPSASTRLSKISELSDTQVETIAAIDCNQCSERLPSLLALSTHYDLVHSSALPDSVIQTFYERLRVAIPDVTTTQTNGHHLSPAASRTARDDGEPPEKRSRSDVNVTDSSKPDLAQMAMLSMMGSFPFLPPNPLSGFVPGMGEFFNPLVTQQMQQFSSSPAKRARTRITDDQLKILRQYFDINNSPTEAQVKEMSLKAGLPEKVIKHWFRNTLFKERQRDKDSPYNFSVPPQMGIDLDTYEKTGETKVVPLTVSEMKRDPSPKAAAETPSVPPTLNLQAMMQHIQQANPFQFMDPSGIISGSINQHSQSSTSGRRANRTRFTDYQLRTLQQFFDKQAYPKDDDLEVLSKKLQLSPRVIVVWFQNARQKARKIYENQPNHENTDRFVRTPGCNFQCKRYEIYNYQRKNNWTNFFLLTMARAQANDNKIVEESLTDEEKAQLIQQTALANVNDVKPADLAKFLGASKSSTEAILKLCETANTSPSAFHKRCPFCGLLFRNKSSLQEHIPARHPQQHSITTVDIELLPNAEDVPMLIPSVNTDGKDNATGVLDLSSTSQDRDTLSISPFLGQSDDDPSEFVEENISSYVGGSSQSRSPTSNKRYRTHLTPTQVHVMKSVFGDYKTPSMTECEALGREIGLHKRVVQVWFQNARAKERKTRTTSSLGDEEMNRPTMSSCLLCGVEYGSRITLQDHLFSLQHLNSLKGQLLSSDCAQCDTAAPSTTTTTPNENSEKRLATRPTKAPSVLSQLTSLNLNGFPFNFMNGMMPGVLISVIAVLPPLVYDPVVFGTPVSMLQIPESVKIRIKSDINAGFSSSKFTQDGLSVDELREKLNADDACNLSEKEVEVGWACSSCTNVFQQEALLKNHQRSVCQGSDTVRCS